MANRYDEYGNPIGDHNQMQGSSAEVAAGKIGKGIWGGLTSGKDFVWGTMFGQGENAPKYKGYGTGTAYNSDLGDKGQKYYQRSLQRGVSSGLYNQVQGGAGQYQIPMSDYTKGGASIMGQYGQGVNLSPYSASPDAVNNMWAQTSKAGQGQFNSAMLKAKGEMMGGPLFGQARNQVMGNVAGNYASQMAGYHAQLIQHANDMMQAGNIAEAQNALNAAKMLQSVGGQEEQLGQNAQDKQLQYYSLLQQMASQNPQVPQQNQPGMWNTLTQHAAASAGDEAGKEIMSAII